MTPAETYALIRNAMRNGGSFEERFDFKEWCDTFRPFFDPPVRIPDGSTVTLRDRRGEVLARWKLPAGMNRAFECPVPS